MKIATNPLPILASLAIVLTLMAYPKAPTIVKHERPPAITDQSELLEKLQGSLGQVELLYYLLHQNKVEEASVSTLENGDELYEFPKLGWKVTKFVDKKVLPRAERLS